MGRLGTRQPTARDLEKRLTTAAQKSPFAAEIAVLFELHEVGRFISCWKFISRP